MAEKLSWTELRRALAHRSGVSEKTAGAFLNALTGQLLEGLRNEKQVKINGLGTFKLQAVAPRKSVDVTTGAEIIIAGYNKVVFSPEAGVKEMIEKGASPLPVTEEKGDFPIADPLKKLGEQADEIVDLLADLGQTPQQEKKPRGARKQKEEPEQVVTEEPTVEPEPEAVPEPEVISEPIVESQPESVVTSEPVVVEPVPEPVVAPEPAVAPEPEPEIIVQKPEKKRYHFVRDTIICVLILLLLLAGAYFFFRHHLSDWIESLLRPNNTEQVEPVAADTLVTEDFPDTPEKALIPEGDIPQAQILAEFLEASGELSAEEPTGTYPDLITTEPMHEASRLTWMAKRYYGDKRYWPYLYDANKDHISNPNKIEVGTPIRVPRLSAEQLDTTIESTRVNLERLLKEAEEACR